MSHNLSAPPQKKANDRQAWFDAVPQTPGSIFDESRLAHNLDLLNETGSD
ncbi:MAG: hypothetical protein KME56_07935 [Candidatus Thiodiazotropha sp. (ex Ctena orbiculata)]|uniref:Uncharacterized protein n=1 Tax=Candidatus Thiodiazotropha taylori TaxID=2792791 RepID=A0A944MCI4_9GAMM|nr:hypothetical protein [Candidatus Thiodiazotropha taylori]MBT2990892.1 hypothetical protein [Candidatus Thiodiazotropha taylori]MBT2996545.1 hypothetical protein [Candidatus Thiodiazotropha taylori]MBT3000585.1 hypothetical protein [Candidatus Thiodiazotropha taylori]MBT3026805.1 hypothetical protein [Candidatus Thiodiazotropha taylori]